MLIKKNYIQLITKHFYFSRNSLPYNFRSVIFINMSYRMELKRVNYFQSYIYFFLTIFFGQAPTFIKLHKSFRRFSVKRGQPFGIKLNISDMNLLNYFIVLFNKWYYYNIFGELKSFFFDKKKGNFFGVKIPFINLFYTYDYNLITYFLFNLNIPNFKIFLYSTADRFENISLKNIFGFF